MAGGAAPARSVSIRRFARALAAARVSAPNSTSSQPPPSGSNARWPGSMPIARMSPINRSSKPSSAIGPNCITWGTWSAAA
jgi:hypothetical protein